MTNHNERLEYVFDFIQGDLRANQRNRMTNHQIKILEERQKFYGLMMIGMSIILIIITVIVCAGKMATLDAYFAAIIFFVAGLVALGYMGKKFISYRKDTKQATVECVCGEISLDIAASAYFGNRLLHYELTVETQTFRLESQEQLLAFENGSFYCIYYAPHSKHVLAAEKSEPFPKDE